MNCAEFEDVVGDLVRQRLESVLDRNRAFAHAAACVGCADRARHQETLRGLLERVAEADRSLAAPPRLERELLQAFRESRRRDHLLPPRRPEVHRGSLVAAALAAAIALASATSAPSRSGRPDSVSAEASAESGSLFLPLAYGDTLADLDAIQIVRVRVPRSALASIGWPGSGDPDAGSIDADLILGHDGVARAIRFVP